MTDLPKSLRRIEVWCHTILNAIAEYRTETSERRRDQALHRIERSMVQAAETIGVHPAEKLMYHDIIAASRAEIARLTAANVARLERGRAA